MLVVTRKKGESILIGDDIEISINKIEDGSVKIAISAPKDIIILRKEVYEKVKEENKEAANKNIDILNLFNK
jgi:carbon storage regulator